MSMAFMDRWRNFFCLEAAGGECGSSSESSLDENSESVRMRKLLGRLVRSDRSDGPSMHHLSLRRESGEGSRHEAALRWRQRERERGEEGLLEVWRLISALETAGVWG
jgi:hypothetical protein